MLTYHQWGSVKVTIDQFDGSAKISIHKSLENTLVKLLPHCLEASKLNLVMHCISRGPSQCKDTVLWV